ncbi:MAG: hypothetical protein WBF42_12785 [Terracidiphilus sp.]
MAEQFENPEPTKSEDETVSDASAEERIKRVAEKAAEKASKTEQRFGLRLGGLLLGKDIVILV